MTHDALLRAMFDAAIAAADPAKSLAAHLPDKPAGRTIVVGAGKAAASMARALEAAGDGPLSGLVVTRYGHGVACDRITVVEASHPVPDAAGRRAAGDILQLVSGLCADDLVIALISGGASALLTLPAAGISFDEKQAINSAILKSGAPISQMNCVRKHLSAVKGGRLAIAAAPARMVTLAISDVPGNDPSTIGSGPTVFDPTTGAEALGILDDHGISISEAVRDHLGAPDGSGPDAGSSVFQQTDYRLIATPQQSLEAAADVARSHGYAPVILGDAIEGDARAVAADHRVLVARVLEAGDPGPPPLALLSGGETSVTVRGSGRGGRNVEYAMALALALDGLPGVHALAGDTDGIDGIADNAGAVITPNTLARARAAGLDPVASLADNDGHGFFEALGDAVVTGPTLTNVNDFRAILIDQQIDGALLSEA
ncbi:MAG: glycerate kinase type-2 family protein [Alphaproteobacteria bacterium]